MNQGKIKKAEDKAHFLDEETRMVLASVGNKNKQALRWFLLSWTVLFGLAVFGIYRQNQIATANKAHIDCIVKDLATPIPEGSKSRVITDPLSNCNIKFQ